MKLGRGRNDCKKALCASTKYMVAIAVIVALVFGILFAVLGQSDIPVKEFEVKNTSTVTIIFLPITIFTCGSTRFFIYFYIIYIYFIHVLILYFV